MFLFLVAVFEVFVHVNCVDGSGQNNMSTVQTISWSRTSYESGGAEDDVPFDATYFENPVQYAKCQEKLELFAHAVSNFTLCIVTFARPIRICEVCVEPFQNARIAYDNIADESDEDKCREVLLNADRIQIVAHLHGQVTTLWQDSKCANCFDDMDAQPPILKNDTREFCKLATHTHKCLLRSNGTICPPGVPPDSPSCKHIACHNCTELYKHLSKFYNDLVSQYTLTELCMDIVDVMNTTRKVWSKDLHCVMHENDTFVLFTIILFVCLFPPVFYLGSYIQSDELKSKIVPQKRLASSRSTAQFSVN